VIQETANIMCGSALLAMYRFLRVSLIHGAPAFRILTRDSERRALLHATNEDVSLVVESQFTIGGETVTGEMVISLSDREFFLDALESLGGGAR
jgi:chemotaxis protein CheY-P-specific phosphatase CheC